MKRFLTPSLAVGLFLAVYLGAVLAQNGGDPLALARLGDGFRNGQPVGREGYDGQFAYYIALDPLPAAALPHLDVPAYRYQRLLYPLLARLLAVGQPALIPWSLALINVLSLVVGTSLVERWLTAHGFNRWYALVYGLWIGLVSAVRADLNEPLCYALIAGAMLAERSGRRWLSALCLALALLTKESALPFIAGLAASAFFSARVNFPAIHRSWVMAVAPYGLSLVPFAVLQLLLYRWFGTWGLGSGGYMATPFEMIPYMGLWRVGFSNAFAAASLLTFSLLVVLPSLWGLAASLLALVRKEHSPAAWVLLANAALLPFTPFSTFREAGGILRLATGLVLAALLYIAQTQSRRVMRYALVWLAGLAFIFKENLPQ